MDTPKTEERPCTAMERRLLAYAVANGLPYTVTEEEPGVRFIAVEDPAAGKEIPLREALDTVQKAIFGFLDTEDGKHMSETDKLLLRVNKEICEGLKALADEKEA